MGDVDYSLVVNNFVKRYVENKTNALAWATKNIDKEMFPVLKPMIREALQKRGYKFKNE